MPPLPTGSGGIFALGPCGSGQQAEHGDLGPGGQVAGQRQRVQVGGGELGHGGRFLAIGEAAVGIIGIVGIPALAEAGHIVAQVQAEGRVANVLRLGAAAHTGQIAVVLFRGQITGGHVVAAEIQVFAANACRAAAQKHVQAAKAGQVESGQVDHGAAGGFGQREGGQFAQRNSRADLFQRRVDFRIVGVEVLAQDAVGGFPLVQMIIFCRIQAKNSFS